MARIRTIKPEFPQSESMGRMSRDARLLFIMLWTIADDSGRLRGNSRMLASLLFPYDDDARSLIDGWLGELEAENCIQRYMVDGDSYVQICNWLIHQKIDKPSASKLPPVPDGFEKPREDSRSLVVGREGKGEEGKGKDHSAPTGAVSSPAGDDPSADAGRVDTPKADPVPYQQIVDAYHELLPMLPRVVTLTDRRKTAIRARWKSGELPDVETWRAYFADVSASDFLCGRVQPSPGRKTFVADIDFLINQANFVKFQEGKYDNERGGRRG